MFIGLAPILKIYFITYLLRLKKLFLCFKNFDSKNPFVNPDEISEQNYLKLRAPLALPQNNRKGKG
ncbi:MAG TPA: hypothetical protein PK813_04730, partial [Candidatus Hydrogenedens sp.]|nr:hypothetical protein [Candidatus Hydrogenedens sp.]